MHLQALGGGQLHHGHFEMLRIGINKKIEESKMFAVWRIDAPWKPVVSRGIGRKMGGGKGSIDHYVTPVKAGRIIVEVGGECQFNEVFWMLVSQLTVYFRDGLFLFALYRNLYSVSVELWLNHVEKLRLVCKSLVNSSAPLLIITANRSAKAKLLSIIFDL